MTLADAPLCSPRRTMNWSEALASVCTHGGAVVGNAAIRASRAADDGGEHIIARRRCGFFGGGGKEHGRSTVSSALKIPGPHKSSSASRPRGGFFAMQEIPIPDIRRGVASGADGEAIGLRAVEGLDGAAVLRGDGFKRRAPRPWLW